MVNSAPDPIKEYYIAYFDVLGYKEFFSTQPEKAADFLRLMHDVIQRTNEHIKTANQSVITSVYGKINIKTKIFSDNVLLCMEASNEAIEPIRLLAFLKIVADIQRGFVTEYGLFVRGGVTKGSISFNDDYVFGSGLIEVVTMEEKQALYPRIIVNKKLLETLKTNPYYTQEESERASDIENRSQNGATVSEVDRAFYSAMLFKAQMFKIVLTLTQILLCRWADGLLFISYLHQINISSIIGKGQADALVTVLKQAFPDEYNQLLQYPVVMDYVTVGDDFDGILKKHKTTVEEKLRQYGNNKDIADGDVKAAELREHILRKYIWVMAYHNMICRQYRKPDEGILTRANCDSRFLKITVEVLEDETGI